MLLSTALVVVILATAGSVTDEEFTELKSSVEVGVDQSPIR